MPILFRLRLAPLLAATMLALIAGASLGAPAPIPVADFFTRGTVAGAALSPSGKHLAFLTNIDGSYVLATMDLATNEKKLLVEHAVKDIRNFAWVSDERIAFEIGDSWPGTSVGAIDHDGRRFRRLSTSIEAVEAGPRGRALTGWETFLTDPCSERNRNMIYLANRESDWSDTTHKINLMRVDTLSRKGYTLPRPGRVIRWMLDPAGDPSLVVTDDVDVARVLYRQDASHDWRLLVTNRLLDGARDAIVPLQFGPDGTLYVTSRAGKDKQALYTFDLAAGRLSPSPLFETAGYDFNGGLVATCSKVLGVEFVTDAASIEWFDPAMKTVQRAVDGLLPRTVNLISVPVRAETPWMLVRAYSDVDPLSWWLFNSATNELRGVGSTGVPIDVKRLGRQQMVRYKARDGLEIPALLTMPPGAERKSLPMVVLVHGGPYMRAPSWGWSDEAQFLASRGYVVLEPAFRGSLGYGYAHFKAGWKQWGLAMQNDLADGVHWAVSQGVADPQRICIAGASYGGYATLMGLVKDPELYRCGIAWSGVTDIDLLFSGSWNFPSDLSDRYKEHSFKDMIGDPDKDAAQLTATSPLRQAARIRRPLLLAHGAYDTRVPITHGTRLRDAIQRTNPDLEWIEYPEEGHGWLKLNTEIDFWTRVERFLARHIGSEAQRAAASALP
jgi:dipeptidyl aminopeptidase/acylaminoacyl peptidase